MTRRLLVSCAALLLAVGGFPVLATPSGAGPFPVREGRYLCADAARARVIPVRLYLPYGVERPPVILFSTGLGAHTDHYAYLGRHWAQRGYAVFMVQHPGSDAAIFRESRADPFWAVMRAALRKRNWADRPGDLRRVLDEIAAPEGGDSPLRRAAPGVRFNAEAVGVAGHSFGAYTALALAGLRVDFPGSGLRAFGDSRVRAVVQMSFPGDMGGALGADAFEGIRVPCLHFSGTRDDTPMLASWADDRRIPFDRIPGPHQYLVTFAGADHFALADNEIGLDGRPILRNPAVHQLALAITTTFWDAFLRDDSSARDGLRRADLAGLSRGLGVLERRNLPAE